MEEDSESEIISSEYALIKKQLRKKERKLKRLNKVLQAKEHVRRTVEVYTRKKSPYKDPKVPDAVKFKEGSPEVIPSVTDQVNSFNAELSKECQLNLENNFVTSRNQNLQRKVEDCNLQSQDLFAPTLAPISPNSCNAIDTTTLTSKTSVNVHQNENLKTTELTASVNSNELQNDSFIEFDFHTLPLNSGPSSNELYKYGASAEKDECSNIGSHTFIDFSNDQNFSQNINIVRKGKSRKRTTRSSQDSLVSSERSKRIKNITCSGIKASCEDKSTGKTTSSDYIKSQASNDFMNYREPNVNSSQFTNNSGEDDLFFKDFDEYSNSLEAFAVDFDEMQIESNSVISKEDKREDEVNFLAAENAESNIKHVQNKKGHSESVTAKVHTKHFIKDSKFSLTKINQIANNTHNEISEELNKKVIGDKNLKPNEDIEFDKKAEIQNYKFPIPESQGRTLSCAINVHNLNTSEVDTGVKRAIPTVLVIQEFGLSLWQYCPKTSTLNQHSKDNFQKSWQEIGRSNYNFGRSSDIMHIVANGLPSVENDVRFYVITKKENEKDGNIIYIQVASNTQFSSTDVVVTESVIPISSVCKSLYSSVLTEWSIAIYYILQLKKDVSGMADSASTSTEFNINNISKALHVEFDLTYLMRKRCWKLDHQTSPLYSIGKITSMVPLSHKDMNGLLLLSKSESKLEVYDVEIDGILKQISCPVGTTNYLQWAAVIKDIIIFMISYKKTVELWSIDSNTGSVDEIFTSNLEISHNIAGNCNSDSIMVNAAYVNKSFFAVSNCGTVWLIPTTTT